MAILKGADARRPVNWLQAGLNKAKCVGRIKGPKALASAFLIDGEAIGPGFAEVPVLVTADFVFDGSNAQGYTVAFEGLFDEVSAPAEVRVQQVVWSSRTLHAAVCILADWPGAVRGLKPAAERPRVGPDDGERAWVIGYPQGGQLQISIEDNRMLAVVEPELRYEAATSPGSSGSPVFNEYWEVVAMHVGRAPDVSYNYGTLLDVIVKDASDALRLTQPAAPVSRSAMKGVERLHTFQSVFISYTHADRLFAERLYTALQSEGVRCWFDEMSMVPGEKIGEALRKGILAHDRVLLCCSASSLGDSWWVENELELAFEREREAQRSSGKAAPIVIPLDLDGEFGRWDGAMAAQLRSRLAADFKEWTDSRRFQGGMQKLLKALELALVTSQGDGEV